MRKIVFTVFGIVGGLGSLTFLTLSKNKINETNVTSATINFQILEGIKKTLRRFLTRKMLHMIPLFLLTGFAYSFLTRIHPTAVGNTKVIPNPMSSVGLVGIASGVGEVVGGLNLNIIQNNLYFYICSNHFRTKFLNIFTFSE